MDESDAAADDPIDTVRAELMKLYENPDISAASIGTAVRKIETTHKEDLGHLAEFWLLLSVGEALAHPTQTYGTHRAAAHRQKALHCADISSKEIRRHGTLVSTLLPARSAPSDVRVKPATIWAKRPYDTLADNLVRTA